MIVLVPLLFKLYLLFDTSTLSWTIVSKLTIKWHHVPLFQNIRPIWADHRSRSTPSRIATSSRSRSTNYTPPGHSKRITQRRSSWAGPEGAELDLAVAQVEAEWHLPGDKESSRSSSWEHLRVRVLQRASSEWTGKCWGYRVVVVIVNIIDLTAVDTAGLTFGRQTSWTAAAGAVIL